MNIADQTAALTNQMLVRIADVRVVAACPATHVDHRHFAERHQLIQRLIGRCPADLRESFDRPLENFIRRQMNMLAGQHLGNDPPLRRHLPLAIREALQQILTGLHATL